MCLANSIDHFADFEVTASGTPSTQPNRKIPYIIRATQVRKLISLQPPFLNHRENGVATGRLLRLEGIGAFASFFTTGDPNALKLTASNVSGLPDLKTGQEWVIDSADSQARNWSSSRRDVRFGKR